MYLSFVWTLLISFASIYLAHRIWDHFKATYTSKQTKNLVEIQTIKYKQMVEELTRNAGVLTPNPNSPTSDPALAQPLASAYLSPEEKNWMVQQLQDFINGPGPGQGPEPEN